ncbi:MAG TPA: serine protease, partial [Blastocatellia bacterium]|nr:serine protease [Blastocatellia bacterium]
MAGKALPAVAVCTFASLAFAAQSANRGGVSPEARAQVRQAIASIGLISVRNTNDANPAPQPRGSSVVVRNDGVLVTNYHVISNPRTGRSYDEIFLNLSSDGDTDLSPTRYRVKPVLISKEYDLALLRVVSDATGNPLPDPFTIPSIALGDSRKIKVLEDLFII